MKDSKFSDAQKAFILKQGADGVPVAEICRRAGISQATYFNWKKKYEGLLPAEMQRDAIDALAAKSTAVVTIVPGPHRARHLAGARIDDMMFWVPQSGDIGLGVSILSYDGRYRIGLIGDARLLPQPQQVIARVEAEFARLPAIAALLGEF